MNEAAVLHGTWYIGSSCIHSMSSYFCPLILSGACRRKHMMGGVIQHFAAGRRVMPGLSRTGKAKSPHPHPPAVHSMNSSPLPASGRTSRRLLLPSGSLQNLSALTAMPLCLHCWYLCWTWVLACAGKRRHSWRINAGLQAGSKRRSCSPALSVRNDNGLISAVDTANRTGQAVVACQRTGR